MPEDVLISSGVLDAAGMVCLRALEGLYAGGRGKRLFAAAKQGVKYWYCALVLRTHVPASLVWSLVFWDMYPGGRPVPACGLMVV